MEEEQVQDQTVNEESVQDQTESSAVEAEEQVQAESESSEEEQTDESNEVQESEQPKKRDARSRIKELLGENKELKSKLGNPQFNEALQNGSNVPIPEQLAPEEYQALVVNNQLAMAEIAKMRQESAYKDFTSELQDVTSSVPELNPDSDDYNPDLEAVIAENFADGFIAKDQYGNFIGTKKSFKEYALKQVEVFRKAQTNGATKTKEVLDRQASEQAVTSSGGGGKTSKNPGDMSIQELEAKLGVVRR